MEQLLDECYKINCHSFVLNFTPNLSSCLHFPWKDIKLNRRYIPVPEKDEEERGLNSTHSEMKYSYNMRNKVRIEKC